jgi:hypothetical protein
MNDKTVDLIERPYQEVVDDILTAVIGGVVNEEIIFDVKVIRYPLAEPALDVRGITGTVQGTRSYAFQKEIDFVFAVEGNAVIWQEGGAKPDDGTVFYADYLRTESRSPLTDINIGSVTRTLGEAIGREIATVYQQINKAYLAAFVDTAEGKSLDMVVSILGVVRLTKDYARGQVTFFRDPAVEGSITIPEGVILSTAKGVIFQTTEQRTLQRGQVRISAPIRSGDDFKGEIGMVLAGEITDLALPIAGIGRITNFDATFLGGEDETDVALRSRAKAALASIGKGTLEAIEHAIFEERAVLVEARDPNDPPGRRSDPGTLSLLVEAEPEGFPALRARIEETRAAGVMVSIIARYVFFKPRVVVKITPGLTPEGNIKVVDDIIAAIQGYIDGLGSGDPAKGDEILLAIKGVKDASDLMIVDVIAWRSDVAEPGAETIVDVVLRVLDAAPAGEDREALTKSLSDALFAEVPSTVPGGARIPDRSLVQGPSGDRATDEEIEAGEFSVAATIAGEKWWVVLDMERADVLVKEI